MNTLMRVERVRCGLCGDGTVCALAGDPVQELLAAGRGHVLREHPGQAPDDVLVVQADAVRLPYPMPVSGGRDWLAARNCECPPGIPAVGPGAFSAVQPKGEDGFGC
ncbi:hypothetical protein ACWEO1_24940 [Kitasatospora cineracea]